MREILSQRGFSEAEIITLEAREDYAEVRERAERLQADRLMDELETRIGERVATETEDLNARWERFKAAVLAISSPEGEQTQADETLEQMRTRLETEAIETAEATIREQAAARGPLAEFFADIVIDAQRDLRAAAQAQETGNAFERLINRIFGGIGARIMIAIAGAFLGSGARDIFANMNQRIQEARNATLPEGPAPVVPEEGETPAPEVESGLENLNITNFRYNSGLRTLIFFSDGRNLEGDTNVRNRIFEDIKDLPLNEVASLRLNPERQVEVFGENLDRTGFREGLDILLPSFENTQFLEVCELSLGGDRIEDILAPNGVENRRLFQILGEQRAREIIRLSNISGFELTSLTMYELSILYSASFPNFAYMRLASSLALGVDIVDTTTEEFQEMVNSSTSGRIFNFLVNNGDGTINSLLAPESDAKFLSDVHAADPEISVEEIQAVINFKNYVLSGDFQNNTSLRLEGDTLAAFNNNLNYTRIIILYDILKGGRVESVNPLNFPLLILAISSIIGGNVDDNVRDTGLAEAYKGQFVRNGIVDFFERNNLSESERRAYEIYGESFIYLGFQAWARRVYGFTRFSESVTGISDETMLGLSTLAIHSGGLIARQGMRRASPMLFSMGGGLRYLGWAGAVIYGGVLGYEYLYGNESETGRPASDPTGRDNGRYIGHQIDRDLEGAQTLGEQMEVLGRLRENTHEYMIGEEPITVITYPGDIPHAVYQGRIWTFQALDRNNLAGDIVGYLINAIRGIGEDEELHDNSVWTDGDRIYIGANESTAYSFSLDELFLENNAAMRIETVRDLWGAVRYFLDENFPGHGFTGGEDLGQYIAIIFLPGDTNTFLGLVAAPASPQNIRTS